MPLRLLSYQKMTLTDHYHIGRLKRLCMIRKKEASERMNIPKNKWPDLSKPSIRYCGGEFEWYGDGGVWGTLTLIDIEAGLRFACYWGSLAGC